ncbi:hypothetical protein [Xenorhabdus innexi]|uniref:Peptidase M10 metallopeptidase domain-containing protein n=1 Tax=Xenorhabdus innexi TaxID=290109 RepID=A0A1N6MZL1_9GAMM|nr:hypothetical protein [Xenorhabdus innexi]PHM37936.1 hypothetical protein Xinn_00745 [Xenorhabdus innexi]SIP74219.1 exported hypothetical protein [Xenorhabdus innexi]
MNLIKKIFIAIIAMLSFLSSNFMAFGQPPPPLQPLAPYDPRYFVVAFFWGSNYQIYNPVVAYGHTIRYTLPNPNLWVTYTYAGDDIDIPIAPLMRRAAEYYSTILQPYLTIRESEPGEEPNFTLQTMLPTMLNNINPEFNISDDLDAITVMRGTDYYHVMVSRYGVTSPGVFFRPTLAVSDQFYEGLETTMGRDHSLEYYAEIYTYALILHEMGHALGLGHPDDAFEGVRNVISDTRPAIADVNDLAVFTDENTHPAYQDPPVMLSYQMTFLLTLNQLIGVPLTIENLLLARREIRYLLDRVSGVCRPLHFEMPSNSAELDSPKANCDYNIVYPLAKTMVPIVNMLLSNSPPPPPPKPTVKTCTVELATIDSLELLFSSNWYTTFTRKSGCEVNLTLKCDGSESACDSGDYSSHNKFQAIIYDNESSYDEKLTSIVKNTEKDNTIHRITNLSSTDNMKFENKGRGTAKVSYVDSICYYNVGPPVMEIKPGLDRAFTVETNNNFFSACTSQPKKISWKIEYTTYE